MPSLESDELDQVLVVKLGCERDESGDHIQFFVYDGGRVVARTKISHGPKHTISSPLVTKMARQLKLSTAGNLVALVNCSLEREDCLEIMRQV